MANDQKPRALHLQLLSRFQLPHWWATTVLNGIKDAVAYRVEFFLGLISSAFVPVGIQLIFWWALFRDGASTFAGNTQAELISYTLTTLVFSQVRGGNHDFSLIELIRTGGLNVYLLRPVSIVQFIYIRGFGEKALVIMMGLAAGALACFFGPLSFSGLLMGMVLAIVGNIIHYQVGAALGAVAFYWENAFAVLMMKNTLVSILSGELIPLYLFPPHYEWVWKSTPFYLYVFGPTQLALGKWNFSDFVTHLGSGLVWMAALGWVTSYVWKRSIRSYQGIGN